MSDHPITVQIITRNSDDQKEIRHEYIISTRHPRWELLKIFVQSFFRVKF